jgi:hypothetical protein
MVKETSPVSPPGPPARRSLGWVRLRGRGAERRAPAPPPILASEALREDVAPLEPGRRAAQFWLVAMGVILVASAGAQQLGWLAAPPSPAPFTAGVGALVLLAALAPVPYLVRGVVVAAAGWATLGFGLIGWGPASGLVASSGHWVWEGARVAASTVLPAVLLFRARYRAYRGARIALFVGVALAIPAAVHEGFLIASGPVAGRVAAGVALLSVLSAFIGFMGPHTTGASTAWAVGILVAFGAEVALRGLGLVRGQPVVLASAHVALVYLVSCTLAAVGLFKVLAAAFARDARRVDVLHAQEPPEEPGEESVDLSD